MSDHEATLSRSPSESNSQPKQNSRPQSHRPISHLRRTQSSRHYISSDSSSSYDSDEEAMDSYDESIPRSNQQLQERQRQQQQQRMRRRSTGELKNSDGSRPVRLRLDLDLEAEVELRARVNGSVTLSLLG